MYALLNEEYSEHYQNIIKLIQNNHIILWDVAYTAERFGSLDSDIQIRVPNQLHTLINSYPTINRIIFNGKKAAQMYDRFLLVFHRLITTSTQIQVQLMQSIHWIVCKILGEILFCHKISF